VGEDAQLLIGRDGREGAVRPAELSLPLASGHAGPFSEINEKWGAGALVSRRRQSNLFLFS